ncbi:hypothetical protein [Sphingobium ummariense]|uniref:Uncharacterized protein n=1 Tax=Sphingobium ummariense RL-3 TaxID=1346791 RepID=T0K7C6_9SPHN|nr:hypothetical protein [Sphingobium ummariense]EQB32554.1 hypothetical protein M529_08980 [Sphingobium ummariense RL-3]
MNSETIVARLTLTAEPFDGPAFDFEVVVLRPYCDEEGIWRTPISMAPLYRKLAGAAGVDSYQSLCLAMWLVAQLLRDFDDQKGQIMLEGKPFNYDAYRMPLLDLE